MLKGSMETVASEPCNPEYISKVTASFIEAQHHRRRSGSATIEDVHPGPPRLQGRRTLQVIFVPLKENKKSRENVEFLNAAFGNA